MYAQAFLYNMATVLLAIGWEWHQGQPGLDLDGTGSGFWVPRQAHAAPFDGSDQSRSALEHWLVSVYPNLTWSFDVLHMQAPPPRQVQLQ